MVMSEFEICRDYEAAADKNKQIMILADMNVCKPVEIIDVLAKNGKISGIKKKSNKGKIRKGNPRFSPDEWEQIKKLHDEGMPASKIAKKLGYDRQAVSNKIWYEKKRSAKVSFTDTKPADTKQRESIDDTYIKELEGIIQEQQVKIGELKAEKENLKLELKHNKAVTDELVKEVEISHAKNEDLQNRCDALEALTNDGAGEFSDVLNDIELLAKLAYGCTHSVVRMDEEIKSALLRICFIISDAKTEEKDGQ